MIRSILIFVSLLLSLTIIGQTTENYFNCYTVVAGKMATVDGSVMVAHNEDDGGDQLLNWYIVPPLDHLESDEITTLENTTISQVKETNGYLWLELPGMRFSDSYLNDQGVVIVSDQCISREDNPELTNGGIGYWLRRLVAERAMSARNGVEIAGELIEKYGYHSSGRTYTIADANEAWVFAAVNGKHWVAQRVKDNEVMVIPNYYTIEEIDLSDKENFLACPDLIEYAIEKGWYKDGEVFNFREVYGKANNLTHPHNINRKWAGMRHFSDKDWQLNESFPFSFVPSQKVTLEKMFTILEDHYDGCNLTDHTVEEGGNPHNSDARTICCESTQYGFVAQLRAEMPKEIGNVLWIAPFRPCTQPYIPWYLGMTEILKVLPYTNVLQLLLITIGKLQMISKRVIPTINFGIMLILLEK